MINWNDYTDGPKVSAGHAAPSPSMWKDKSKGLRVRQGDGSEQLWKLDGQTPVLVNEQKTGAKK